MEKNKWDIICEDTDFVEQVYFPNDARRKKEMEITSEAVTNVLKLQPGCTILDLCCGTGATSIPLTKKGYFITGVDFSINMLKYAKKRAKDENVHLSFKKMNILNLDEIKNTYDAIIWLDVTFGSIGGSKSADKKTIESIRRRLKPGGKFLMEIYDYDYFLNQPNHKYNGTSWVSELKFNSNEGVLYSKSEYKNGLIHESKARLYTKDDLESIINESGFRNICISNNLWGNLPVSHNASLFLLCEAN